MPKTSDTKRIGRPRSEESRAANLDATWKLLKTTTLRDLSIEAIDILYGAIYFRLLVGHLPLDQQFADELPQWTLKALKLT
jgi:hypothetical protein